MTLNQSRWIACRLGRIFATGRLLFVCFTVLTAINFSSRVGRAVTIVDADDLPAAHFYAVVPPFHDEGTKYGAEFTWHGQLGPYIPLPSNVHELAYDPGRTQFFGMGQHEFYELDNTLKNRTQVPAPALDEDYNWLMGVTYDSARDDVVIATLGGLGFFYAYDPVTKQLSKRHDVGNIDLTAITYYPNNDHVYGLAQIGDPGFYRLHEFTVNGELLGTQNLDIPALGAGHWRSRQLFTVGNYLAFLDYPNTNTTPPLLYAIDPSTGQAWQVVPEPSSIVILMAGGIALLRLKRRKC
jgi:hypothetical protein